VQNLRIIPLLVVLLFGVTPGPVLAQDPVSAWTVAQTIAGVISVIVGWSSGVSQDAWQKSASNKLNLIIAQNESILAQLKDLGIQFPQQLEEKFDEEAGYQAKALANEFDLLMSARPLNVNAIRQMEPAVQQLAYNLSARGPAVFEAQDAMAVLGLAIYKVDGTISPPQRARFYSDMVNEMTVWAGADPGMFGATITSTQTDLTNDQHALDGLPKGSGVVLYSVNDTSCPSGLKHPSCKVCTLRLHADVAVDETQYTISITSPRSDGCAEDFFDDDTVKTVVGTLTATYQTDLARLKNDRARLAQLQGYEAELTQMIADYKKLQ